MNETDKMPMHLRALSITAWTTKCLAMYQIWRVAGFWTLVVYIILELLFETFAIAQWCKMNNIMPDMQVLQKCKDEAIPYLCIMYTVIAIVLSNM